MSQLQNYRIVVWGVRYRLFIAVSGKYLSHLPPLTYIEHYRPSSNSICFGGADWLYRSCYDFLGCMAFRKWCKSLSTLHRHNINIPYLLWWISTSFRDGRLLIPPRSCLNDSSTAYHVPSPTIECSFVILKVVSVEFHELYLDHC